MSNKETAAHKKGTATAAKKPRQSKLEKQKCFLTELAGQVDSRWRKAVCDCDIERNLFSRRRDDIFFTFRSGFVHGLLTKYVDNPGKVGKTTIANLAKDINDKFSLLDACEFLKFEFLSTTDKDSMQAKLKNYSQAHFQSYVKLVRTGQVDDKFFQLIQEGKLIAALIHLLNGKLGVLLLDAAELQVVESFSGNSARSRAHQYVMQTSGIVTAQDKLTLANNVYAYELEKVLDYERKRTNSTEEDVGRHEHYEWAFEASKSTFFCKIVARLKEYHAFLKDRYNGQGAMPVHPERARWGRSDATRHATYIPLLLEKDFRAIDQKQNDAYFRWTELPSNHYF